MIFPRLFVLMGIPGCGKSTWSRRFFHPLTLVSSDAIREEKWPGEPYDHERNAETFRMFHQRLADLLERNFDAVADATSLSAEARHTLYTMAKYHGVDAHLIVFTNNVQARENNHRRTASACVPEDAMKAMIGKYSAAIMDIKEEPWDSTTYIEAVEEYDISWAAFRRLHE